MSETCQPKFKIFAVDDSRAIQMVIKEHLSSGFDIQFASGGLSAFKLIDQGFYPDLIISDIQNPEIDGVEFLRIIRSREDLNAIPVLMLSASFEYNDKMELICYKAGANRCLVKPFNPELLKTVIEAIFRTAGKLPYSKIEL
jgi:two-component system, chemotaxis family, chemotaxis protein CheY